jgi:hypothetical protein
MTPDSQRMAQFCQVYRINLAAVRMEFPEHYPWPVENIH